MAGMVGPYSMDGVTMPTWLIRFDKNGQCTSPETRAALLDRLGTAAYSDIVFFSHGWNNDFDDATRLYASFLHSWESLTAAHPPTRPAQPLFVGVLWPSIWLSFDSGPAIAGGAGGTARPDAATDALIEALAAAGATAEPLRRARELLARPSLGQADAAELAALVAPAFGAAHDDEGSGADRDTTARDLLFMLASMQQAAAGAAAPVAVDDWGESPEQVAAGNEPPAPGQAIQSAGWLSALDPRQALRLFSVYRMKDRAGTVGTQGVAPLLRDVMHASAAQATPLHAVGHSYGCKVMLSAICAPPPPPRPVQSLLLLQPALSHLAFADEVPGTGRPGGYRLALDPARVRAPIYSTYSRKDMPLHTTFHLALRRESDLGEAQIAAGEEPSTSAGRPPSRFAALGGYGPRRAGQRLVDPIPAAGAAYPAAAAGTPILAFDGSQGLISSHGDVTSATSAWALHQLMFR